MIKNNPLNLKKKDLNLKRSRSKSLDKSKGKIPPKNQRQNANTSRNKSQLKSKQNLNPSLARSQSKKSLKKSKSEKKLKKMKSQPKLQNDKVGKKGQKSLKKEVSKEKIGVSKEKQGANKEKMVNREQMGKSKVVSQEQQVMKTEEKEMGLILFRPDHDRVQFKPLEVTDEVFDKYLEMINNDNDSSYVMNAIPELKSFKKEDDSDARDFVSGRISRLSGIFENLSVDKIITPLKKVPNYYSGVCGKNLTYMRLMLVTKFKVEVDLGFLQYSLDGEKLTIFRIYISKIYRRMNYIGYVYLETFKALMAKHPGADRYSIFILDKNITVHKFFKYLGFKIQKIATESKNKSVDYFQEFTLKKKELHTVIGSLMK